MVRSAQIPLVIGSAGSAGARPHLDQTLAGAEIASDDGLGFRMAVLRADVDKTSQGPLKTKGVTRLMTCRR
jgi:hypothetical protein